jgi:hypothetical protein
MFRMAISSSNSFICCWFAWMFFSN